MSLWEKAVSVRRYNGGNAELNIKQGDYIYIGEFSGGSDGFDMLLDKFVGGLNFDSDDEPPKECKVCPYIPQKKSMDWVSSFIKDYLKQISKHA